MDVINGYNHNIKYKDSIFHIQTEDSGRDKAHVITHLYYGGNIVSTQKSSYAELLADEDWRKKVVELMQTQHKNMMKGLIRGQFDDRISERTVGAHFLNGPAPLNVDAGSQHRTSFGGAMAPGKPAETPPAPLAAAAPAPVPVVPKPVPVVPVPKPVTDPIFPAMAPPPPPVAQAPAAAPAPAAAATQAPAKEYDGTFQVDANFYDLLVQAATTISSEDLANALESNDDSLLFGSSEEKEEPRLDDMMLSFFSGMG